MTTLMRNRVETAEKMLAADFFREAPDEKAELIDGVLLIHMPPLDVHEDLFGFMFALLRAFVEENNLGIVRGSRTAVELADNHVYEPDILFVQQSRREIIGRKGVVGAPDLVIEILSASTAANDRGVKFEQYQRAGVREYWIIDPYGPTGTAFYFLLEGQYTKLEVDAAGIVRSSVLPDFWLDTAWLWPQQEFLTVRQAMNFIGG